MGVEERIATLQSTAEECIGGEEELRMLLHGNPSPVCFQSFQPSSTGRVDIAQGVGEVINVNKMIRAGCRVSILIEDQRAGGDSGEIKAASHRIIEVWKALGMNLDAVEFIWSSEEKNKPRAHEYWPLVMDIERKYKVQRLASLHPNPGRVMG
jgi:tyrosyl-tRNA synthetase